MSDEDTNSGKMDELVAEFRRLRESNGSGETSLREILADSRRELELRALRPFPHLLTEDDKAFLDRQDELNERYSRKLSSEETS